MRALLRFAPVFDPGSVYERGRDLEVQRGALEKIRPDEPTPVFINHDRGRPIGRVREIFIAADVNAGVVRDWYFASAEIPDPPAWLKVSGAVSWSYFALRTQQVGETTRILRALISEISILSPATRPAKTLARVAWIGSPAAAPSSDRAAVGAAVGGEIIHGGGLLRRPGIGRVLGVR
jgi:hypothetical protein